MSKLQEGGPGPAPLSPEERPISDRRQPGLVESRRETPAPAPKEDESGSDPTFLGWVDSHRSGLSPHPRQ